MRWARLLFGLGFSAWLCLPVAAAPRPDSGKPLVSIIIDDLGQNLARDRQVLDISPPSPWRSFPTRPTPPN